jgi:cysteinyl-tRNA synthetase
VIRYFLSQAHYRSALNFSWEGLEQAAAALQRVHGFARRLGEVERTGPATAEVVAAGEKARVTFTEALADDLNTPEALAAVHGLVNEGNALLAASGVTREGAALLRTHLEAMNSVFGVLFPPEAALSGPEQELFDERLAARKRRDFKRSDELRDALAARGIVVEDNPAGTRWRRSN